MIKFSIESSLKGVASKSELQQGRNSANELKDSKLTQAMSQLNVSEVVISKGILKEFT